MVKQAAEAGYAELDRYYADIAAQGKEAIAYAEEHGLEIAVLAGRPYHIDPEINHGIDRLIQSYNMVIVSEDAVAPLAEMPTVNVLNQWTYHSRMYAAANWAVHRPDAQLVQLVSFGCGIDAVTTDEMRAITEEGGKIYTQLKIDEINNLGAAQDSHSQHARRSRGGKADHARKAREIPHVPFTEDMKKDYTILVPNMLPVQLKLITSIMKNYGYNMEVLETEGPQIAECGLKNVHNDTCYPALLVIGQFIDALESGTYDLHKVALMITADGRRLPCVQLHSSAAQGTHQKRHGVYSGHLAELLRLGEKRKSGL